MAGEGGAQGAKLCQGTWDVLEVVVGSGSDGPRSSLNFQLGMSAPHEDIPHPLPSNLTLLNQQIPEKMSGNRFWGKHTLF